MTVNAPGRGATPPSESASSSTGAEGGASKLVTGIVLRNLRNLPEYPISQ